MFGVFLDVTERKLAEEAREMLAGEMGHRVKNLFAIAAAHRNFRALDDDDDRDVPRPDPAAYRAEPCA